MVEKMKSATGIEALEIPVNVMGSQSTIHPTLIWDCHTVILVDTGYPGKAPQVRVAIEGVGVSFDSLDRVIITHNDIDHTGGLSGILGELPDSVEVLAHKEEKPYIQAERPPARMDQVEARLKSLPGDQSREMKVFYEYIKANYQKLGASVDRTLADGEELPYCGGITVIHTPGHTPGHICLYHGPSKTLIAGDALFVEDGQLVPAPQFVNLNPEEAAKSLKKLTRYDIETVICYHGGLYKGDVNQRLTELL